MLGKWFQGSFKGVSGVLRGFKSSEKLSSGCQDVTKVFVDVSRVSGGFQGASGGVKGFTVAF